MAKSESKTIDERLHGIFQGLMDKMEGVDAVFLVDLNTSSVLHAYPKGESDSEKFIGVISGKNVHSFESTARSMSKDLIVAEMVLQTKDGRQVYITRVAKTMMLCIVGNMDFQVGFAKLMCEGEGKINQDILSTFSSLGMPLIPA